MNSQEQIVIVGYGWVGQANALALKKMGHAVSYYDVATPVKNYPTDEPVYQHVQPIGSVLELDSDHTWYIVCVGDKVLPDGTQDISAIERALESLKSAKGKVILRSTVLPRLLARLSFDCYMPEFLHEKNGVEECLWPYYFVLGNRNVKEWPSFITRWMDRAGKVFEGSPEQAAYIKYLSNTWNASRIALVNEFGDLMHQNGLVGQRTEDVIDFVFARRNYLKYGKGFGGHCLPKDMSAFSKDHNSALFKAILATNAAHQEVASQRDLKEWFSSWDHQASVSFRKLFRIFLRKLRPVALSKSVAMKATPIAKLAVAQFKRKRNDPKI
jgi:UDP-glucose 6-dehydrogenase